MSPMADLPQMYLSIPLAVALALGAAITSTAYALWLNTPTGRRWERDETWVVVAIGVTLTLAWYAPLDWRAAAWVLLFFVVTGVPQAIRAMSIRMHERARIEKRAARDD